MPFWTWPTSMCWASSGYAGVGGSGGFRRLHAMHSGTRRSAMKAGKTIITQLSPSLRNLLPQWLSFPTNADPHKAWHISPLTCTRELALLNTWTLQTGAHKWYYFQLDACLTAFLMVSVFPKTLSRTSHWESWTSIQAYFQWGRSK